MLLFSWGNGGGGGGWWGWLMSPPLQSFHQLELKYMSLQSEHQRIQADKDKLQVMT